MDELTSMVQQAIDTEIGRTLLTRMCQERAVFAMRFNAENFSAEFHHWLGSLATEIVTQYPLDEKRVLAEVERLSLSKET